MKKWVALILSIALVLSLAACSNHHDAYLALNQALKDKNYTTELTVGGSANESVVQQLGFSDVKAVASISFLKSTSKEKCNGFAYVFSFKNETEAVSGFAAALKMYLAMGLAFKTVDSDNGKKAIFQGGEKAMTFLTQAGNTVIYTTEHWETTPKGGVYEAGLGKILEDLGY